MHKKILFLISLLAVSPHFAQEAEIKDLLGRIEERKSQYVRYDSFISMAYSTSSQMDKNWTPAKTTIVEKKIIQEKNRRLEEIIKATELNKGKESDITEEYRKEEMKRRERQEKRESESTDQDEGKDGEGGRSFSLGLDTIDPFAEQKRSLYDFSVLSDSLIGNRPVLCIQTVVKEPADTLYYGRYFVDKETMDILFMDLYPSKNPKMVKELHMKMAFDLLPGNYYVITTYWMKVYAGIIIKKIRFEVEEHYSGYQILDTTSPGS